MSHLLRSQATPRVALGFAQVAIGIHNSTGAKRAIKTMSKANLTLGTPTWTPPPVVDPHRGTEPKRNRPAADIIRGMIVISNEPNSSDSGFHMVLQCLEIE